MFEPDYTLMSLLIARRFIFPEALLLVALLRLALGQGWVRLPAAVATILSAAIVATVFAPALGYGTSPAYAAAARAVQSGGLLVLLTPAALLLAGAVSRTRPCPWVEIIVAGLTILFVGLWVAATLV
jgi:hypothetical protein